MIDTSDYNFKLVLKKKSKHEKPINDYHLPKKSSPHVKVDHAPTSITTPRKLKPYRLNKSSNDILSEPKAIIDSFTSTSSLSSNALHITNHFDTRHPPRKSSYLTNLNLVLDSASKQLANNHQLPNWQSFYIKKMVEFGFNPNDDHQYQQFKSRSDNAINKLEEPTRSEIDFEKSIKRLKASKLERTESTRLASDKQNQELASSQSKSYYDFSNQKNKSATKFFSPSLIILPELDETVANTNTSYKDNLITSNLNSLENDQDNFNLFTDSSVIHTKMSRQVSANKTNRSELTLPPIVETKVNNFTKKSNSSRVDSGIAVEYENHGGGGGGGGGGGWHQSSNASENGVENVITTIEIVEPNSLKKNGTSSTLNSYGKSSSIQSKTSVTNNTNSSKLGHNSISNSKQIKASLSPANEADDTSKLNKQPNTPKFDSLTRQNTLTSMNNHENLPLVNKQNLNPSVSPTQQQQQKPVPKPRNSNNNPNNNPNNNNNKRALSLQRQNTLMPTENSQFLKENNQATQDKKLLKRESTNLGSTKPVNITQTTNNVGSVRPKTGNANNRTVVTFNINTEQENIKNPKNEQEQENTSKPVGQTPASLIKPNEFDILKYNEETENVLAALNLMEHDEQAMNDFTMARIMKWLEEVENCHNMMQPPSQLAWSNNQSGADRSTQKRNSEIADIKANFMNNEYCLSDYDSLDEQIIEYNRVVDKTYHIVHDED